MTQEIEVLKSAVVLGKEFKIYGNFDNPLFLASDVAEFIEHSNSRAMLDSIDEDEKVVRNAYTLGGIQECNFVTESGLYEILMQSRKPIAKAFKKEVKQIIHDIRRFGIYATPQKLGELLADPETAITLLTAYKEEQDKRKALETQIEADKPKVIFADSVAASQSCILIGDLAKILKQNGIEIGAYRLFEWMREHGYLMKQGISRNIPTQKALDLKLFVVKETAITHSNGDIRTHFTTKITGKGQAFFVKLFLAEAGN